MKRGRRNFLIAGSVIGGSLVAGLQFGLPFARRQIFNFLSDGQPPGGGIGEEPTLWLKLTKQNHLSVYVPKVEMGQGIHTALGQIAAEELEIPWESVQVFQASTLSGPVDSFGTGGSASVSGLYTPLRQLAANYRTMLEEAATDALDDTVYFEAGIFRISSGLSMSLGEASRLDREWIMPEKDTVLKPKSKFKLIGQSVPRLDLRDILTATPRYAYDARSNNNKNYFGAVARAPMIGAILEAVDSKATEKMKDVVKVVVKKNFAGVIATTREAAWRAADALNVTWKWPDNPVNQESIDAMFELIAEDAITLRKQGSFEHLESDDIIESNYSTPFASTAPLEPQSSFAELGNDEILRVKTPTQFPNTIAKNIAQELDIESSKIDVLPTYLGGGFGRRSVTESAIEASILAYSSGLPVHVGWRREDEFQHDLFRPATRHVLRGALAQNKIQFFHHLQASGDVLLSSLPSIAGKILGSDFAATRGIDPHYEIENIHLQAKRIQLPVPTASWRGLGLLANTFAMECFVDELSILANQDPVRFRLQHLSDQKKHERVRNALIRVTEMSNWKQKKANGVPLGVACCIDYGTVVAIVAEIDIINNDINVSRIWAAMDCGQVINPDGAINQVEGNIVWGVGSALQEEVIFENGNAKARNFDNYPLLRLQQAPTVEVTLLPSDLPPQGVGEPAIGPVPAAIANAVYSKTGKRLRSLPLKL